MYETLVLATNEIRRTGYAEFPARATIIVPGRLRTPPWGKMFTLRAVLIPDKYFAMSTREYMDGENSPPAKLVCPRKRGGGISPSRSRKANSERRARFLRPRSSAWLHRRTLYGLDRRPAEALCRP